MPVDEVSNYFLKRLIFIEISLSIAMVSHLNVIF